MIGKIARKEFIEMIRDGRFRTTGLIVFLLLVIALITGWKQARETRVHQELAERASRRQWENQEAKNPHSAAHFGAYAFKQPMPLAYIDRGVDAYLGVAVWIEAHKQNPFLFRPAEDSTSVGRFGESTAASVLQLILPLVIILLAFAAFAGERERGTLRQLLSLGVSGRELVFGKALGLASALALLLIPATLIGAIALVWRTSVGATADSLGRLLLMVAGYLLYFSVFVALSLAVSARAASARIALVWLVAFWIVNCLLAPRLAADLSERLYRTPTGKEFWEVIERDMREGVDGHNAASRRTEELKQQILKQYGVARVEDLPVNFAGIALQAGEEYGNRVFDRRYGELWQLYEKQNRIHGLSALLAPLAALRPLSMGLAGTDFAQHRDFARAAENYRRMLNKTMNETLAYQSRGNNYEFKGDHALWQSVPEFAYRPPGIRQVARQQLWNLGALLLWFVVVALIATRTVAQLKP